MFKPRSFRLTVRKPNPQTPSAAPGARRAAGRSSAPGPLVPGTALLGSGQHRPAPPLSMATSFPTPPLRPGAIRDTRRPESSHLPSSEHGPDRGDAVFRLLLWPHFTRGETEAGNGGHCLKPGTPRIQSLPPPRRGATLSPASTTVETHSDTV